MRLYTDSSRISVDFKETFNDNITKVREEVLRRGKRGRTYLRDAVIDVLKGNRSGRMYGKHRASAPGEAPAVDTGKLRNSFEEMPNSMRYGIESISVDSAVSSNLTRRGGAKINYAWIDKGLGNIKPRPYVKKATDKAVENLLKDLKRPYNV